ncbi:Hint domain-containing protein [Ketogulonicigenium vulgare]|uniref:Type I secretion target repeat protein n=2 Tax=Ketogulonicigenium vulgare TaxID=92945 RepID=F9Y4Y0_KETVW|nr:Hint domain-containing protein [Ketogulonicigenium vulgare]ADO43589.1 hemolysin-type calcium-binding region [Ketogulonicigenium vulgare Y25]AEM41864.1 Type I secretion target repeat protein [Ketogulonicigenium vulgare WSH-001]ALJ81970.1 type I secretion protein [Ketogulonicigenium vulgare]ANW34609.1 type I secretion protein [Ketogulonicigenium vulgare]AOZ55622.1 hemolysin-type calcium-binding region [Ketogulonicigenium vulgare]
MASFIFLHVYKVIYNSDGSVEAERSSISWGANATWSNGESGDLFEVGDILSLDFFAQYSDLLRYEGAAGPYVLASVVTMLPLAPPGLFAPGDFVIISNATQAELDALDVSTLDFQPVAFDTTTGLAVAAPCFTAGTLIETPNGPKRIEDLVAGDLVVTRDNGPQILRWVGESLVSAAALAARPKLRPIRISAGALGTGLPTQDLLVSPQHRVLVQSKIAARMFDQDEVLVPAVKLTALPGIFIEPESQDVRYFHMLFDRHEIVISNGALTESLHTGPIALRSLPHAARIEIFTLFPDLAQIGAARELARPVPKGSEIASLLGRHAKNDKPLQQVS